MVSGLPTVTYQTPPIVMRVVNIHSTEDSYYISSEDPYSNVSGDSHDNVIVPGTRLNLFFDVHKSWPFDHDALAKVTYYAMRAVPRWTD